MASSKFDEPAMIEPRLRHVQCLDARGLHRMAYWEWGDPRNTQVVVCAHGLTRQGRDFDALAADLSKTRRVVCPDVVGRGQSDWLTDAMAYAVPTYVADMVTLLARLDAEQVDWVGTSMGGLIGMGVSALKGSPVRRLVLNDVGPRIELAAVARIAAYVGQPSRCPSNGWR
jgi:pimeloyl-ACP methyl ester carboxylesterase